MKHHTRFTFNIARLVVIAMSMTFMFGVPKDMPAPGAVEAAAAAPAAGAEPALPPMQMNPSIAGRFGPITSLPLVPVHMSVLPDGRVLFWSRDKSMDKDVAGRSEAYVWNPANGAMLRVANTTTNLFCSGHSFLPDGRLLVTGGHKSTDFDGAGEKHTNIFDYRTNAWTRGPDMNNGRWYPFNVTLGTGETVIVSGSYWSNDPTTPPSFSNNNIPQVYTPATNSLRELSSARTIVPNYPYLHLAPNGKIFQAGPNTSRWLDPNGNLGLGQWTNLGPMVVPHTVGSSVTYDGNGKVLVMGGLNSLNQPTNNAEVTDLNAATPTWRPVSPMNFNRIHHTSTVLPDGKVLVTGGTRCPGANTITDPNGSCTAGQIMFPEMWDPVSETWSIMASHQVIRIYHSLALLLPDGRVLVGGGGRPGGMGEVPESSRITFGHNDYEIFSPPYLFNPDGTAAQRPALTSAPTSATYGQTFFAPMVNPGNIAKVSLVRLPSVTHGFNQDQRVTFLSFNRPNTTGLNITIPSNRNVCPPGYYMLFVIKTNGVPSVAKIIRIG